MKKTLPLLLLLIIVILVISAGVLYFGRLRTLTTEEAPRPPEKYQEPGEVIITYSVSAPNQKEILRTVGLNGISVEDLSYDEIEIKGEKKTLLNLTVSFKYIGKDRTLTIPIIDSIYFRGLTSQESESLDSESIDQLDFGKGTLINFGLAFLPKENVVQKEEVIKFCESLSHKGCLVYIELGFGDKQVDFEEYLRKVLEGQDGPKIDYTLAFPNIITLLPN